MNSSRTQPLPQPLKLQPRPHRWAILVGTPLAIAILLGCIVLGNLVADWAALTPEARPTRLLVCMLSSTACLLWGSWSLHTASQAVSREQIPRLLRSLQVGLLAGAIFAFLQTIAVRWLIAGAQDSVSLSAGELGPFAVVLAAAHAMHFAVAYTALLIITLLARGGRYDHEYWWDIWACEWCWHYLLLGWLLIYATLSVALLTLNSAASPPVIWKDPAFEVSADSLE
jgi:heme/copper-type cytochrome/quinol oxidase subunit 3